MVLPGLDSPKPVKTVLNPAVQHGELSRNDRIVVFVCFSRNDRIGVFGVPVLISFGRNDRN